MKLAGAFVCGFSTLLFPWKVALGHQSFDSQKPFNFQSHFILGQLVLMHCCCCAEIAFLFLLKVQMMQVLVKALLHAFFQKLGFEQQYFVLFALNLKLNFYECFKQLCLQANQLFSLCVSDPAGLDLIGSGN